MNEREAVAAGGGGGEGGGRGRGGRTVSLVCLRSFDMRLRHHNEYMGTGKSVNACRLYQKVTAGKKKKLKH